METISNTDFDRLEKLLYNKLFDELSNSEKQWVESILTEEEYVSMWTLYTSLEAQKLNIDILPRPVIKDRLNKALAVKVNRSGIFQLKMPMYQSVAAALIFFLIGFGINLSRSVETKIVHDVVQVIKYINKPDTTDNPAIVVPIHGKKRIKQIETIPESELAHNAQSENSTQVSESNTELIHQQEIAMININRTLNEKNGSSLVGDTILQKMLVTLY